MKELNVIIAIILIVNMILLSIYFHNMRNEEDYEYGINLYRGALARQYAQFSKNHPN